MKTARRTEGPRAPLFFSASLILLVSGQAAAQPVELSDLEICAGLESAELKLACFDAIIATGNRAADPGLDDARPIEEDPVQPPVDETQTRLPAVASDPDPVVETSPVASVSLPASAPAEEFGQEHLPKATETVDSEPETLLATVVEVTQARNRGLSFHLANGQVWRQIEPRYFPYPKDGEFKVTISTGVMGEYRLRVGNQDAGGRMVRIRRVR